MGFDTVLWRIPALVVYVVLMVCAVGFGLWGLWRLFLWVVGKWSRR